MNREDWNVIDIRIDELSQDLVGPVVAVAGYRIPGTGEWVSFNGRDARDVEEQANRDIEDRRYLIFGDCDND
jgi:hypothetical protein